MKLPGHLPEPERWVDRAFGKLGIDTKGLADKGPHFAQVLKAHTTLEAALTAIIRDAMAVPEHFDRLNLKFPKLVHLGLAIEVLSGEFSEFLFKLEAMRNRLAHERGADVSRSDIDAMIKLLPSGFVSFMEVTGGVVGEIPDPLAFVTLLMIGQLTGEVLPLDQIRLPPKGWRPDRPQ
jgi:hypothetical protein